MDTAGLVMSAASLALQLGQFGQKLLGPSPSLAASADTNTSSAEQRALEVDRDHEYQQTKTLSAVLFTSDTLGFKRKVLEGMSHKDQEVSLAILSQLFRLWSEYHDAQTTALSAAGSAVLHPLEGVDVVSDAQHGLEAAAAGTTPEMVLQMLNTSQCERLKNLILTIGAWNRRLERTIRNATWLQTLQTATAEETMIRLDAIATDPNGVRLDLVTPARLRQMVIIVGNPSIDKKSLTIPDLRMPSDCINVPPNLSSRQGVISALYRKPASSKPVPVLIEFLPFTRSGNTGANPHQYAKRRIDQLTALLHIPKKPEFRLPEACGYFEDQERPRYGIVFLLSKLSPTIPTPKITTLQSILHKSPASRPTLGSRFRLAHALACAVRNIQSIGWVHQNLRSENIIFLLSALYQNDSTRDPDPASIYYQKPWIFGYGSSRLETVPSVGIHDDNPARNLYRHPDRWGIMPCQRFNKYHDIYSLGVILLEIGYWAPITLLVAKDHLASGAEPRRVMENMLLLSGTSRLTSAVGESFAAVAKLCLMSSAEGFGFDGDCDDKLDSLLQAEFDRKVIDPLGRAADAICG